MKNYLGKPGIIEITTSSEEQDSSAMSIGGIFRQGNKDLKMDRYQFLKHTNQNQDLTNTLSLKSPSCAEEAKSLDSKLNPFYENESTSKSPILRQIGDIMQNASLLSSSGGKGSSNKVNAVKKQIEMEILERF